MKILIEFYRTRAVDDAHATVERIACDALDFAAAIGLARSLFRTLDMPQSPDAFRICDGEGNELFRESLD